MIKKTYFYVKLPKIRFRMKIKQMLIGFIVILSIKLTAQEKPIKLQLEAQTIGTSNAQVPFWMRSNQFGSVPTHGASGSLIVRATRDYSEGKKNSIDWGAGFEGRSNLGNNSKVILIEGYGKVKASIFQLKIGRTKDVVGLNGDTSLSSGNFSLSGNALGVPKVEISIPDYWRLPVLGGAISLKGTLAHGWIGSTRVPARIGGAINGAPPLFTGTQNPKTYLHQKSLYGRIGREDWKINLFGGVNHQAFWGNEDETYGENFGISTLKTWYYVALGKTYGRGGIPRSKIGNQLGSIDVGLQYSFKNFDLLVYRQNFYDVGALSKLANIRDGLTGIVIKNTTEHIPDQFRFKKLLVELFYSKHQAGELGSIKTRSGDEDYYNNFFYIDGWSYKGTGLGNPLITHHEDVRGNLAAAPADYFSNNRVIAIHTGVTASLKKWEFTMKTTFSKNYGTFATSMEGRSLGNIKPSFPEHGLFGRVNQFSGYLEVSRNLKNGYCFGAIAAVDQGQLLYNSQGLIIKAVKTF